MEIDWKGKTFDGLITHSRKLRFDPATRTLHVEPVKSPKDAIVIPRFVIIEADHRCFVSFGEFRIELFPGLWFDKYKAPGEQVYVLARKTGYEDWDDEGNAARWAIEQLPGHRIIDRMPGLSSGPAAPIPPRLAAAVKAGAERAAQRKIERENLEAIRNGIVVAGLSKERVRHYWDQSVGEYVPTKPEKQSIKHRLLDNEFREIDKFRDEIIPRHVAQEIQEKYRDAFQHHKTGDKSSVPDIHLPNHRAGVEVPHLSMADAIIGMWREFDEWCPAGLANVRSAIRMADPQTHVPDDNLFYEFLPVVMSIGLQPLMVLWDAQLLNKGHEELNGRIVQIANCGAATETQCRCLQELVDEYMAVFRSWHSGARNLPWDEVTARALSRLGVGKYRAKDGESIIPGLHERMNELYANSISPLLIMMVSEIVTTFPGNYWRNIKQQFILT